ncbi:MAG: NTP transferase domain-containing protein, partial [Candidatus Lokiarchaeota archaeon]|nr:NTP transferase domain-containing protein [Candidatus Lokiarchaeota archaeon]
VGRRLLPITKNRPKPMIPVAGKPLLQYTVDYLKQVGINNILIVVGYLDQIIRDYFGDGGDFGVNITYINQQEYSGTANATKLGQQFVNKDNFLLIYGDIYTEKAVYDEIVGIFKNSDVNSLICLKKVEDPTKYGIISLNQQQLVDKIVEKPKSDEYGNLANAGIYIFNSDIFEGINRTEKSARGEYEITDSIQILIDEDYRMYGYDLSKQFWNDVGHPWQLIDTNKEILKHISPKIEGTIENNVSISGDVYIGKNTTVKSGTYIEGPAYIGDDAIIGPSAYIRPYSFIGKHCKIGNSSEIKNSIILKNTYISHLSYIGDSIVGSNVNFGCGSVVSNTRLDKQNICMNIKDKKVNTKRKKMGAIIGDNTQLGINTLVFCGRKIGNDCFIGPGTIVSEDVPDNHQYYVCQKIIKKKR